MRYITFFFLVSLTGCSLIKHPGRIITPSATVVGVPEAGKPATIDSDIKSDRLVLPKGSSLTLTKFEALASIPEAESNPAVQAQPAKEVVEVKLSEATEWKRTQNVVHADTGTVDTSIAKHRIDVAENRYLLWAALGAAVAAGLFLYIKYPTPAFICGAASLVFFLAWKLSDLPSWFYVVGVCCLVGAVTLWRGHHRGEQDQLSSSDFNKTKNT